VFFAAQNGLLLFAEEYVHRIGRTGRVGNNGEAVSFFDMDEDFKILKVSFLNYLNSIF
jgi:superfamily II DNA/RNA helicase